jgi:hypothetical protein
MCANCELLASTRPPELRRRTSLDLGRFIAVEAEAAQNALGFLVVGFAARSRRRRTRDLATMTGVRSSPSLVSVDRPGSALAQDRA